MSSNKRQKHDHSHNDGLTQIREEMSRVLNECSELKAKVANLEGEVKSLQTSVKKANAKSNYLEVLLKNQHWEYPLPVPTIDELVALGYEGNHNAVSYGIEKLAEVTTSMRRGESLSEISLSLGFVPDYDGYLPHFQEFADAIVKYQHIIDYKEDETFSFALRLSLPREILDVLQEALQRTHFHELHFERNNIEHVGYVNFISNCVTADTRLKRLTLMRVNFEHSREISALCTAINNNGTLQDLSLRYCRSEGGILREIFCKLKSATLKEIDLGHNHRELSNLRPTDVPELLSSNPSLEVLYLHGNPFNEHDIVQIADTLRQNVTLRLICFKFNTTAPRHGMRQARQRLPTPPNNFHLLDSVIFDHTSLTAAYDSNHYCRLWPGVTTNITKFNIYINPTLNRRKKIYSILSSRNKNRENAACFELDGIDIKHMPHILALLKPFSEHHLHEGMGRQDEEEVNPLSITYEIIRDWKMPELTFWTKTFNQENADAGSRCTRSQNFHS